MTCDRRLEVLPAGTTASGRGTSAVPRISDGMADFCAELTRHQPRLRGLIRCLLFDRFAVEDVLQDTNVTILRKAADYQMGTDFWAWASQVARYQVLTHCKRLRRDKLVFSEELIALLAAEAGSRMAEFDARREALDGCLAKLPPPQRQLLELRYGPKASIEEIAQSLDRTAGSIRQALFRIREALQACIERRLAGGATP
jgi:RNA polymerase sigma-70 factor (ECF subfamily)